MSLRYIFHDEPDLAKQFFRRACDFLSVLKRARRVIRNDEARTAALTRHVQGAEMLADIQREPRDARGLVRIVRIAAQHEPIILDRRAATRRGDQDGIEPLALDLGAPGVDLAAG